MTQTPPGWYPDPENAGQQRYYDGTQWTENRAPVAPVAPPPAAPPAKKKRGCLTWLLVGGGLLIAIIVIAAIASSGGSSSKPSSNGTSNGFTAGGSTDSTHEVKITSCGKDALGDVDIKGTAVNDTSKRSDFLIDLTITDGSGKTQLGTSNALAQNVEPGQTAQWDGPSTVTWKAGIVCKVATVSRTASV